MTSTTQDPALAERSVSWRAGQAERLAWKLDGERFSCDLRYDAATSLPDGMLFVPAAMEDEWVIAWRQGKIAAARSWTGAVSAQGAEILRGVPLASFGPFGHRCFSADIDYAAPKSKRPLRSDGPLIAAIQDGDAKRIKQLMADGNDIHAPSTFRGYTALYLAVVKGELELVKRLLELGADPNRQADEARTVLPPSARSRLHLQIVDLLLEAGAHLEARDDHGFYPLHAAAEVGSVPGIRHLLTKRANYPDHISKELVVQRSEPLPSGSNQALRFH